MTIRTGSFSRLYLSPVGSLAFSPRYDGDYPLRMAAGGGYVGSIGQTFVVLECVLNRGFARHYPQ